MPEHPMSTAFQRDYLLRLPLPLAQLYSRAYNAKDARARHDNAFYLCEALVKLAAAPAVACYLHEADRVASASSPRPFARASWPCRRSASGSPSCAN